MGFIRIKYHSGKRNLWEKFPEYFDMGRSKIDPLLVEDIKAPLYEEIGRLKVENDFLKKNYIFVQIKIRDEELMKK